MKRMILFSIILLCASTFSVEARIGEKEQECTRHYGQPLAREEKGPGVYSLLFRVNDYKVVVGFLGGRVHSIEYKAKKISDTKIQELLEQNRGRHKWHKFVPPSQKDRTDLPPTWKRSDKVVIAFYRNGVLTIKTAEWSQKTRHLSSHKLSKAEPKPEEIAMPPEKTPKPSKRPPKKSALLVGRWSGASDDGIIVTIDFKEDMTLEWTSETKSEVHGFSATYEIDPSSNPIAVDIYDIDSPELPRGLMLGIVEFLGPSSIRFEASVGMRDQHISRPSSFGNTTVELKKVTTKTEIRGQPAKIKNSLP